MSYKITKSQAKAIAESMSSAAIRPKINQLKNDMADIFEPFILKEIPKGIFELYKKHPNFFSTSDVYRPFRDGDSGGQFGVQMSKKYPSDKGWSVPVEVDKESFSKMEKINDEIKDLKKKENEINQNIYATLIQLSTFKKINESFNEAMSFIPEDWKDNSNTSIAIPIENLRKELQQFNCK